MQKPVIAIDCDDVIVGTAPELLRQYNETHGTAIPLDAFYSDDLDLWGVTDLSVAITRVEDIMSSREIRSLAPHREAVTVIGQLAAKYELHVVTGRHDKFAAMTHAMLNEYFPDIFSSVEFTNFFSERPRSKATVCEEIGASYLIDDHLHHALVVAKQGIEVLLSGSYPWNAADKLPQNIRRVRDWPEIADLLLA